MGKRFATEPINVTRIQCASFRFNPLVLAISQYSPALQTNKGMARAADKKSQCQEIEFRLRPSDCPANRKIKNTASTRTRYTSLLLQNRLTAVNRDTTPCIASLKTLLMSLCYWLFLARYRRSSSNLRFAAVRSARNAVIIACAPKRIRMDPRIND